jgi:hypothetical protein
VQAVLTMLPRGQGQEKSLPSRGKLDKAGRCVQEERAGRPWLWHILSTCQGSLSQGLSTSAGKFPKGHSLQETALKLSLSFFTFPFFFQQGLTL